MITFVCYPKCTTCQKAQKWLDAHQIAYALRDIKADNPTAEELAAWHRLSGLPLKKFFNTSGLLYRSLELKDKLGMAIIMITHDLGIVARMCEKIAVMYAGKIVEYGTTDEIFYEPKHEYTKGLLRSIPRLDSRDHERLVPIEGTPVDMLNPPKGCPFAPRCGACMKVCLREMPPRTDFSDTHYTQCWLCQKAEFEAAQGGNVQ